LCWDFSANKQRIAGSSLWSWFFFFCLLLLDAWHNIVTVDQCTDVLLKKISVYLFKFYFYKEWFFFCRSFRALVLQNSLNFQVKLSSKCNLRQIRMEGGNLNCSIEGNRKESRGALIVLEGLDRSGKSSQCSRLVSYLEGEGLSAELWRFPDRTTNVGQMISAYLTNASQLDDHTIHLLFSANRWEKRFVLLFLVS